jgi:hypothetical protein
MRVRVAQAAAADLRFALRQAGCVSVALGEEELEIAYPSAQTASEEATALRFFLRAWQAARPAEVEIQA